MFDRIGFLNIIWVLMKESSAGEIGDDKREVKAFRSLKRLNSMYDLVGYGFSSSRFGNMSVVWAERQNQSVQQVRSNQERLANAAGFDYGKVVEINPEAGNKILVVGSREIGKDMPKADALITMEKDVVLVLKPADCTPIIITNRSADFVAMVHAGREGTKAKICKEVIKKLLELGFSDLSDFVVGAGPTVECYTMQSFATDDPDLWLPHLYVMVDGEVEGPKFLITKNESKYPGKYEIKTVPHRNLFVDITGCNVAQLVEMGIPQENIETAGICTVCNAKHGRLFSHGVSEAMGLPNGRFVAYTHIKR